MKERSIYFVGEEGDGRLAGNVDQVLKGIARYNSSCGILRITIGKMVRKARLQLKIIALT